MRHFSHLDTAAKSNIKEYFGLTDAIKTSEKRQNTLE
jgi:hypothetical protein